VPNDFDPADPFGEPETLRSRAETVVKVVDEILTGPTRLRVRSTAPVMASQTSRHRSHAVGKPV
jgi:hypothetical protein